MAEKEIIAIQRLQPELVFLDIEMPDMTGFEMLRRLEHINFQTIFTTAHSSYAIKAIRFNALDYLVKPIDQKELALALERFHNNRASVINKKQVQIALANLNTNNTEDQILSLQTQEGQLRLPLKNIVRIEGERNYSYIHLSDQSKKLTSKTLGYFEDILLDKGFFRCHRSHLVNGHHLLKIQKDAFLFQDQSSIPISRRKKSEARKWFQDIKASEG